jgi:hypothetical protein
MKKSPLSQTNPYLRDKAKRLSGLVVSVCSSSAIEGIAADTIIKEYLKKRYQPIRRKSGANFPPLPSFSHPCRHSGLDPEAIST